MFIYQLKVGLKGCMATLTLTKTPQSLKKIEQQKMRKGQKTMVKNQNRDFKNTACFLLTAFFMIFVLASPGVAQDEEDPSYLDDYFQNAGYEINDPFESYNRAVFKFNASVDRAIIHPALRGYRTVIPKFARTGVRNFLRNLKSPVIFANQLLQGDLKGAHDALLRATINSLLGIGGLFDLAGYEGIEYEVEDFGQTLAVWGVGHGPYVVVPFLGPSSLRDYTGYAIDSYMDPLRFYYHNVDRDEVYYAKLAGDYIKLRLELMDILEDLEETSFDYYAATRSTYYQNRAALIEDQSDEFFASAPAIPEYDDF